MEPFLWGAATSSHQIEGGNQFNDWWQWELEGNIERGERSLTRAVESLAIARIEGSDLEALPGGAEALLNVNTPDDLAEAERRLRAAAGKP